MPSGRTELSPICFGAFTEAFRTQVLNKILNGDPEPVFVCWDAPGQHMLGSTKRGLLCAPYFS